MGKSIRWKKGWKQGDDYIRFARTLPKKGEEWEENEEDGLQVIDDTWEKLNSPDTYKRKRSKPSDDPWGDEED